MGQRDIVATVTDGWKMRTINRFKSLHQKKNKSFQKKENKKVQRSSLSTLLPGDYLVISGSIFLAFVCREWRCDRSEGFPLSPGPMDACTSPNSTQDDDTCSSKKLTSQTIVTEAFDCPQTPDDSAADACPLDARLTRYISCKIFHKKTNICIKY